MLVLFLREKGLRCQPIQLQEAFSPGVAYSKKKLKLKFHFFIFYLNFLRKGNINCSRSPVGDYLNTVLHDHLLYSIKRDCMQ